MIQQLRRDLIAWYDGNARALPWRGEGRTPYRVLVSEVMLQQTQVKTVLPYFERFVRKLPTIHALASADEQVVLRLWQGLGYYSRARNLHKAAKVIVADHGGEAPQTIEALLALPGIGRYTAGAIASIAFGVVAPILDGNVTRVLCRLDKIHGDPRDTGLQKRLWQRAAEVVDPHRPGDFNSAMMELGATVCIPRSPQCLICPVAVHCQARAAGVQDTIPPPKKALATPLVERDVFRITNLRGEFLIEQRPMTGRWAGMWQFITREPNAGTPMEVTATGKLGEIKHSLTHRRYIFRVFGGVSNAVAPADTRWVTPDSLADYPMSRPQVKVREITAAPVRVAAAPS